jgi:hypothetical protein
LPGSDARNADAVIAATGRSWDEWTALLLHNNATTLTHPQIAQWLVAEHGVDGWWAQSITVHFEQHTGRRLPGQNNDGTFAVSASATLPIGLDALLEYFTTQELRTQWLPAALAELNAHKPTSRSISGRYLDTAGGRFAFFFTAKSDTKTAVSVNHSQLTSEADATALRAFWKDRFRSLASMIAAATGGTNALP